MSDGVVLASGVVATGAAGSLSPSAYPLTAPDGSVSNPSYSFASDLGTGFYRGSTGQTLYSTNGVNSVMLANGVSVASGAVIQWSSTAAATGAGDVVLQRDAAGILAQRNGSTAQEFRVYNTFTDLSNYERFGVRWSGNVCNIESANAGTGTKRQMNISAANFSFITNAGASWNFNTTGMFLAVTDNTFDIGASGANRPRSIYLSGALKQIAGVTSVGTVGVPVVVAANNVTAQAAANASIATFTSAAADSDFEVSGQVSVTVSTALATTLTVTYTDVSNTARTMIMPVQSLAGTFVAAGAITGVGVWETPVMHIRAKASTAITVLTSAGTFTGVTYSASAVIRQLT